MASAPPGQAPRSLNSQRPCVSIQRVPGESKRQAKEGGGTVGLAAGVDGVPGRRALEGDSCGRVASAGALILALTIDPNAPAQPEPPLEPPPPAASPAITTAPLTASPPRAQPRMFARA